MMRTPTGKARWVRSIAIWAIQILAIGACFAGCHARHTEKQHFASWAQALGEVRAGLEARQLEWGAIPKDPEKRRVHLGQLAAYARTALGWARIHPPPRAPEELATFLPVAPADFEAEPASEGRFGYYDWAYAIASRRYHHRHATLWVDVIDTAASIELITPFEVRRVAARHETGGPFRERSWAGFPAVATDAAPETNPGAPVRALEVLVADRILVAVRGDRASTAADLEQLAAGLDLATLASTTASESSARPSDPSSAIPIPPEAPG